MELKEGNGRLEIELPTVVDLPVAAELRDILLDALARDSAADVVLKAASVERLSTAAVQVVLSASGGFKGAARRFEVETPSAAVTETFTQLGLASDLQKLV
ncbi:STAS domain-containing protein [Paramagnetospirillum kuznetsovii]|nr:STAS domain-containing protein [Paramagnetospirillum kuznetsovii]